MNGRRRALLHEVLSEAAARWPDAPAFADPAEACTFAELDRWADAVAAAIGPPREPGEPMGVLVDRTVAGVAAIYGVLRAGGAYVPLDPAAPPARRLRIAEEARLRVVATVPSLADQCPPVERVVPVDRAGRGERGPRPAAPTVIESDPAYVLFTSGSTGTPKGVVVSHRAALAFVEWAASAFEVGPSDRVCAQAPFHFDLSVFDLFSSVAGGAATALMPRQTAVFPRAAASFAAAQGATIWYSVPTLLIGCLAKDALRPDALSSLRLLLYAGEPFPKPALVRLLRALPGVEVCNLYGPTETNVVTWERLTAEEVDARQDDTPTIGWPVPGARLTVVGEDGRVVPDGEVGELWVEGPSVTSGYLNRPELDAGVLVASAVRPGSLAYRTGDLVRVGEDGRLSFLGRRDAQVKTRGYRVELGEVEHAVSAFPGVEQAVAVAVPDDEVGARIAVFVVGPVDEGPLRAHCARTLPHYMIPEHVELLSAVPTTSSGKVDRSQLRTLASSRPWPT